MIQNKGFAWIKACWIVGAVGLIASLLIVLMNRDVAVLVATFFAGAIVFCAAKGLHENDKYVDKIKFRALAGRRLDDDYHE
jgi:hypothetical protein